MLILSVNDSRLFYVDGLHQADGSLGILATKTTARTCES